MRKREMAKFDAHRRAVGKLNPVRDEATYRGGRGADDTCDHALPRRSLTRVKHLANLSWEVKVFEYCILSSSCRLPRKITRPLGLVSSWFYRRRVSHVQLRNHFEPGYICIRFAPLCQVLSTPMRVLPLHNSMLAISIIPQNICLPEIVLGNSGIVSYTRIV